MVVNVGISGFGRIGRVVFRSCISAPNIAVSAINDPAIDAEYICYLIKFDSTHGKFKGTVSYTRDEVKVNDKTIKIFREKSPINIPWWLADVQYVIEASGLFTSIEKASGHLAGESVKRVIVTAPSNDVPMIVLGVNENKLNSNMKVISCTSSTLYCLAPIIKILEDNYGICEGFVTSIHAMTPSLKPLDALCIKGKHWRDHRSIHQNIIPAATGACRALGRIIPQVKDKMLGLAFRVPIVNVSVLDLSIRLKSQTDLRNIVNKIEIASISTMSNIIKISTDESVSSDFAGDVHSCTLDVNSSLELRPDFYKLICWYENEYSYACRVIDTINYSEKQFAAKLIRPVLLLKVQEATDLALPPLNETAALCEKDECSASLSTGYRSEPTSCTVYSKKPVSTFNSKTIPTIPKKYELFKIWHDETENIQTSLQLNKRSIFQGPYKDFKSSGGFVMVDTAENLLNKCYSRKLRQDCKNDSLNRVTFDDVTNDMRENKPIHQESEVNACIFDKQITVKNENVIELSKRNQKMLIKSKDNLEIQNTRAIEKSKEVSLATFTAGFINNKKCKMLGQYNVKRNESLTSQNQTNIDCKDEIIAVDTKFDHPNDFPNKSNTLLKANDKISLLDETLKKHNILLKIEKQNSITEIEEAMLEIESDSSADSHKDENECKKHIPRNIATVPEITAECISRRSAKCISSMSTITTFGNTERIRNTQDIYDKLDSASDTDSQNSFQIHERKSQIINISDITNSFDDLVCLDKICKIIEISDELSDKLFSSLDKEEKTALTNKEWSFRDLCDRLSLDEFCNKVFGKT